MSDTKTKTAGQIAAADVAALVRARNPIVWIATREEARAEAYVVEALAAAGYPCKAWDCAAGITDPVTGRPVSPGQSYTDPGQTMAFIRDSAERGVWILRDLPAWLKVEPTLPRLLKNLARKLPTAELANARAVVIVTPAKDVPEDLAGSVAVVDWPLPDRAEIAAILDASVSAQPADRQAAILSALAENGSRDRAIDSACGLTADEAKASIAKSLVTMRTVDSSVIVAEKKRIISREPGLEWINPLALGLAAIGGLANLKAWLVRVARHFTAAAREYGLRPPRGIMLLGVQGCGKSHMVKAIGAAWRMPILRWDIAKSFGMYVGQSESNVARVLKLAEAVSPCILWIDEIEKAVAGGTGGGQASGDGGVTTRVVGQILTWTQEREGSVFVVATANDVQSLSPELLRRFSDGTFFVDVPTRSERIEILATALTEYGRKADGIDLSAIADASEGFIGSEVAALVSKGLALSFEDGARPLATSDLLTVAGSTVPLTKTAADKINALRAWAQGKTIPASIPDKLESAAVRSSVPTVEF